MPNALGVDERPAVGVGLAVDGGAADVACPAEDADDAVLYLGQPCVWLRVVRVDGLPVAYLAPDRVQFGGASQLVGVGVGVEVAGQRSLSKQTLA